MFKKLIISIILIIGFNSNTYGDEVSIQQLPIFCGSANAYECFVGQYDNGINDGIPYIYGTQLATFKIIDSQSGNVIASKLINSDEFPDFYNSTMFSRINLLNGDYIIISGRNSYSSSSNSYRALMEINYIDVDAGTITTLFDGQAPASQNYSYPIDITTNGDYIYFKGIGKYLKMDVSNYLIEEIIDINAESNSTFLTNNSNWVRAVGYTSGNDNYHQIFQFYGDFFLTYTTHSGDIYKWQYTDLGAGTEVFNGDLFYESELVENSLVLSFNDLFWTNFDINTGWTFLYSVASVNNTTQEIYTSTHSITYTNDGVTSDLVGNYYILNRDGLTFPESFYFSNGLVSYDTNIYYVYNKLNNRPYYWKNSGSVTLYTESTAGAGVGLIIDPGTITYPGWNPDTGGGDGGDTNGLNLGVSLGSPEPLENGINYNIWDIYNDDTGDSLNGELYFDVTLSGSSTIRTSEYNYGFDFNQLVTYPYHQEIGNYFIEPIFISNGVEYNLEETNGIGFYYTVTLAETTYTSSGSEDFTSIADLSNNELVGNIINWYDINLPDDPNLLVNIPYPILTSSFGIGYQEKEVELLPITDTLGKNEIPDNISGKYFISFILALIYIIVRLMIIGFLLYIFKLYYQGINLFISSLFGTTLSSKYTAGNWASFAIYLVFIGFVISSFIILFNYVLYIIPVIDIIVHYLTVLFSFINISFFDYGFFKVIVNIFFNLIIASTFTYLTYLLTLKFARLN